MISVVLAVHNEQDFLADCLVSVKDVAGEIVVVDGASTDSTREIARKYGARVIETRNRPMFHTNKQMAIDAARGDWVLQLDADERLDAQLAREIQAVTKRQTHFAAYAVRRKNFFLGRWLRKGGQYPDPVIRYFRRGKARLPQKSVHEQLEVDGEVGTLDGHLIHHTAPTFSRYLSNANRYTSLTSQEFADQGVRISLGSTVFYVLVKPLITFSRLYLRHKGFLDGFPGFVFALFSGLHWPIAFMKYWEMERMNKK